MRRKPSNCCLILLLLFACGHARTAQGDTPDQPKTIPSRQRGFTIPFAVTAATSSDQSPREVFLYVSADRGAEWKLFARAEPEAGRFAYQAPADGEYWFLVRTVNQAGQVITSGAIRPELKVLVDTVPPTLQLSVRELPSGEVEARLSCRDQNLDTGNIKVEYQVAADNSWHAVPINPSRVLQRGDTLQATVVWRPEGPPRAKNVRAVIADRAGNRSTDRVVVDVTSDDAPVAARTPRPSTLQFAPAAGSSAGRTASDMASSRESNPLTSPPAYRSDGSAVWPRDLVSDTPLTVATESETPTAVVSADPVVPRTATAAPIRYRAASDTGPDSAIRPHVVQSRTFHLEYETGQSVVANIAKADLWGTFDAGRTWRYFGTDIDRRSPFVVTVPRAGLYGFRLNVQLANTPAQAAPRQGQPPEMWVLVHDAAETSQDR